MYRQGQTKIKKEIVMTNTAINQSQFISMFENAKRQFVWNTATKGLVGQLRGDERRFNPVTAVAYVTNAGRYYPNTKRGTVSAARSLGMNLHLAMAIYQRENMGHSQVINGKLRRTVARTG
jgi:hypothetical protein